MGKSRKEISDKANRKAEKKVEFYQKVKDSVSCLNATKTINKKTKSARRQKKLKAYDLSAFSEFLPDLSAPTKGDPRVGSNKFNCKSKNKLLVRETGRLNFILNHEAFKADPFSSVLKHLESTQPPVPDVPKQKIKKNGSQKRKKK